MSLPPQPARFRDLRLHAGLDPKGHFTQQKQVTALTPGEPFVVEDAIGSRFEVYDSLAKVYTLYATLSKDPKLAEFRFVLTWPTLKPEEKRAKYSEFACHELNFFLAKKDPAFFQSVVRPYLASKKDKTFLDRWLLGEDVGRFAEPWQFGRLNTVERVLLSQRLTGEPPRTARHLARRVPAAAAEPGPAADPVRDGRQGRRPDANDVSGVAAVRGAAAEKCRPWRPSPSPSSPDSRRQTRPAPAG